EWDNQRQQWNGTSVNKADDPKSVSGAIKAGNSRASHHLDIDGDGTQERIRTVDSDGKIQLNVLTKNDKFLFSSPDGVLEIVRGLPPNRGTVRDGGLRLIDVNGDKKLDCLFSNSERYCLYLFKDMKEGWATKVFDEVRGKETGTALVIPPFVRADGTNNGAFFHSGALCVINEDTARLPNHVQIITFAEMLKASGPDKTSDSPPPL